jgi:hypothetical protein
MGDSAPDHLLSCNLKLEDEFVLTRIRSKAKSLTTSTARDQFFWSTVYRFVCRERAYQTIMDELGISIDTNIRIMEDDLEETES